MLFSQSINLSSSELFSNPKNGLTTSKRKRRPAGTPDPDAEIISLSPKTLMESDRYVCEICNHGFQREQNLQMHRRCHKVPWEILKRKSADAKQRVYVCPEPTCLHHHPSHALGDLVGIKKHFRRKHSGHKQWVCEKCSKGYAVQADYKAHLKTCGTRGHTCDCGRVFSRIDIFMEHQDTCRGSNVYTKLPSPEEACRSRGNSSTSIPLNLNLGATTTSTPLWMMPEERRNETVSPQLSLSIGSDSPKTCCKGMLEIEEPQLAASILRDEARVHWRIAMVDKTLAEEKRQQAKWQIEMAKQELVKAQIIRQQALTDLNEAQVLKDCATKQFWPSVHQITCHSCKKEFQILSKGN